MEINHPIPDFELPDLNGKTHRLIDYRGRIVILNFWSCECPHSERTDLLMVKSLANWIGDVELILIAANRNESAQSLEEAAKARSLPTVLMDAGHVIADLYKAVTTPHIYVVDRDGILRYRGAVDDVTFRKRKATRFFLGEAVESLLNDQLPSVAETPAYGCTIVREI